MLRKLFLINLFFLNFCFSHQNENFKLQISLINEKNIKIEILDSKTNKEIFLNQIKVISSKNKEVLEEFLLSKENQIISIPKEEYYILAKIENSLIYKNPKYKYLNEYFIIFICIIVCLVSLLLYQISINKVNRYYNNDNDN